jgi:hypothetical protein
MDPNKKFDIKEFNKKFDSNITELERSRLAREQILLDSLNEDEVTETALEKMPLGIFVREMATSFVDVIIALATINVSSDTFAGRKMLHCGICLVFIAIIVWCIDVALYDDTVPKL